MLPLKLYSPVNFVVGLQAWLWPRAQLTHRQALDELERDSPRWGYRLAAGLITGMLLLYAFCSALPKAAEPVLHALAKVATGKQVTQGIALVMSAGMLLLSLAILRRVWRFYTRMCQLGHEIRGSV